MQQQTPNRLKPFFENINFEREDNTMVVNFGPQHPSAHGQMRLILELKGEEVVKARPDIGYLHRGMEKMAENMIYNEFLPTTDRMDYIAATSNNYGFALAVEKLLNIEVPRRAEIIRTMLLELNRIVSHIFWLATHALDVGAMSVFLYTFREREYALDLIEDYCGARLTHSAVRIGGVPLDLPSSWCENLEKYLQVLEKELENYEGLLTENRIWRMRLENVGVISQELAKSWGVTGIALRATGIKWDLRKEMPYGIYPELDFDIPIATTGDAYGRYKCYIQEMRESIKILKQLIPMYKDSKIELMAHAPEYISAPKEQIMTQNYSLMQHFVLVTQGMRPPKGEVYVATESPKGELGFMIVSDGTPYVYKLKVRAPSFFHTGLLEDLLPGLQLADVVTLIGNLNMVFGEIDR
ncbi:NADH-quinone oxidoreductase subunit D [Malaciobacter molluscorum LMG 25693]|uniref:NADH-quinone oxidoreductase subunit D n=1 Tax=Malaciobacter molluscorum LMG 25693 TaxID=870501 RepID=A0A2G1DFK2_9BACT|nr:NADH dehydrogenase (quinone) subunit D [Malaciobacter molluscorum]AXX93581.1 NADH:quinone oxidoreductase I, chain D [Malaciobacter molluscorum LMG 25693]PHO17265.1 NADH-quinone oxidoreductase subunit D [Malaciobacter molluscorum LMG 25693]